VRFRAAFLIVVLAGCDRVVGIGDPYADAPSGDAPRDGAASYRKTITITSPAPSALAEFPLSILIDNDPDLKAHAPSRTNISFADAAGNHLGCEIVRYDQTTGSLDAWVRVPSIPANPETLTIDLVYGDTQTPCGGTEAWPQEARAVWHSNLAVDRTLDSTAHGNELITYMGRGVPSSTAGLVGEALSFDGGDTLCTENATGDGSLDFGTGSFAFSLWIYERRALATYDAPLAKNGATGFVIYTGMAPWSVQFLDGASTQLAIQPQTLGAWINITVVVDRAAMLMRPYRDGVAGTSLSISSVGSLTSDGPACLSKNFIDGNIDEARIFAGALSPSWIQASYVNIAQRSQMISIGPEN
jgi:hypothetical protein